MHNNWIPIKSALWDDDIRDGITAVLAVNNTAQDGFYQVVYWDKEAAAKAGNPGTLGSGYGWSTMDQEIRYHLEFFTHFIFLPKAPD